MKGFKRFYWNIRRHFSNLRYHIRKYLGLPRDVDFEYVDLVFENCNWVRIPSRMIQYLTIDDIRKSVWSNCVQQYIETTYCKNFIISIDIKALDILTNFQESPADWRSSFEHHLKEYQDITHVAVKPKKKKELYVAVPYKTVNENSDINLLQKVEFVDGEFFTISCKEEHNKTHIS